MSDCILCGGDSQCGCSDGFECKLCRAERERDEAREVARAMLRKCDGCVNDLCGEEDALFKRCRVWLDEEPAG